MSFKNKSGAFPKMSTTKNLCSPAFVYFAVSILGLILIIFNNLGNKNIYNLGTFSANVPNTTLVFIIKLIYILFWTWILNLICRDGHSGVAWALVLFPFILIFLMMWMASSSQYEGMKGMKMKKEGMVSKKVAHRKM
jgi:hypothetical protein